VWVLKAVDAAKKCDAWYFANCLAERHKTAWFFRNELRLYAALMIFAFALLGFAGLAFHLSVWSTLAIIASFVCIVSTTRFGAQCKVMIGRTPEECEMKAVKFWMVFWVLSLLFFADSFIMATGFAQ
jgi:hypothetical protein